MGCLGMRVAIFAAALALAGCSQAQMFAAGDLSNASALATAVGDTAGATCWDGLMPAVGATPAPQSDGLAVLAERKRLLLGAISGPCAPIVAEALVQKIQRVVP